MDISEQIRQQVEGRPDNDILEYVLTEVKAKAFQILREEFEKGSNKMSASYIMYKLSSINVDDPSKYKSSKVPLFRMDIGIDENMNLLRSLFKDVSCTKFLAYGKNVEKILYPVLAQAYSAHTKMEEKAKVVDKNETLWKKGIGFKL